MNPETPEVTDPSGVLAALAAELEPAPREPRGNLPTPDAGDLDDLGFLSFGRDGESAFHVAYRQALAICA